MGWNDHLEDNEIENLPPQAHGTTEGPFDPDDHWLRSAAHDDQQIAMREWFLARFCDPAQETPYNGREGGYLFVDGGPYDPADELSDRFSDIVDDEVMQEVIDELHAEHGEEWAPVRKEASDDYDERYALSIVTVSEPMAQLRERLKQTQQILDLQGNPQVRARAQNLVFGAAIGVLEAFLYETVDFWVNTDDQVVRNCITKLPVFKEESIKLGDIFDRQASLKKHVQGYLQNLVWHRWDKVVPLFKHGLGIDMPSLKAFDAALLKRHDIVHRSGYSKEGTAIYVSIEDIRKLCSDIQQFAEQVDQLIEDRNLRLTAADADGPPPPVRDKRS